MDWEYRLIATLFFGAIFLIILLIILFVIINKLCELKEEIEQRKIIDAQRDAAIREKWFMSRDEFEDAAKVALNLQSAVELQVYIEKEDKLIQMILAERVKIYDEA